MAPGNSACASCAIRFAAGWNPPSSAGRRRRRAPRRTRPAEDRWTWKPAADSSDDPDQRALRPRAAAARARAAAGGGGGGEGGVARRGRRGRRSEDVICSARARGLGGEAGPDRPRRRRRAARGRGGELGEARLQRVAVGHDVGADEHDAGAGRAHKPAEAVTASQRAIRQLPAGRPSTVFVLAEQEPDIFAVKQRVKGQPRGRGVVADGSLFLHACTALTPPHACARARLPDTYARACAGAALRSPVCAVSRPLAPRALFFLAAFFSSSLARLRRVLRNVERAPRQTSASSGSRIEHLLRAAGTMCTTLGFFAGLRLLSGLQKQRSQPPPR